MLQRVGKRELQKVVFDRLELPLTEAGFKLIRSKDKFIRRHQDREDIFLLTCLDAKPGLRLNPAVAVRFGEVEEIFHKVSDIEQKFQSESVTIGAPIGEVIGEGARSCSFVVDNLEEAASTSEKIDATFKDIALPYFERFSTLEAIDEDINQSPLERAINRGGLVWHRCATGLIVARLVDRPNYLELVQIYSEMLRNANGGRDLYRLEKLVSILYHVNSELRDR